MADINNAPKKKKKVKQTYKQTGGQSTTPKKNTGSSASKKSTSSVKKPSLKKTTKKEAWAGRSEKQIMASNLKRERLNFIKKINQRIKRLEESGIDRNIILDLISDKNLPNVRSTEGRVSISTTDLMSYTEEEWNDIQFALEEVAPTRISMVQNYVGESEQYTSTNLQTAVDRFMDVTNYLDFIHDYYEEFEKNHIGTWKTQTLEYKETKEKLKNLGKAVYNKDYAKHRILWGDFDLAAAEDLMKE